MHEKNAICFDAQHMAVRSFRRAMSFLRGMLGAAISPTLLGVARCRRNSPIDSHCVSVGGGTLRPALGVASQPVPWSPGLRAPGCASTRLEFQHWAGRARRAGMAGMAYQDIPCHSWPCSMDSC